MGYVADLSLGGLRLVASQPLAVGGCYEMVLHVPEHGERVRQIEVVVISPVVAQGLAARQLRDGLRARPAVGRVHRHGGAAGTAAAQALLRHAEGISPACRECSPRPGRESRSATARGVPG